MRGALFLAIVLNSALLAAGAPVSPFNGLSIEVKDDGTAYAFLISGHFYGSSSSRSGLPAATVLAERELFSSAGASFLLTTGDLFINTKADLARHRRVFYDQLGIPVFNAVGNHDLDGGDYEALLGPTSFAFDVGPDRFVVLDTERDDGRIIGRQAELLFEATELARQGRIRNLFVISHRPVWAEVQPMFDGMFEHNTRSVLAQGPGPGVLEALDAAAAGAGVFWFAGSMGGGAPASILWQVMPSGVVYGMSAVRDEPRDALLLISVDDGGVHPEALSLTGRELPAVKDLDVAYWRSRQGDPQPFNWRLLPLKTWNVISDRAFWWGMAAMLVMSMLLRRIVRR